MPRPIGNRVVAAGAVLVAILVWLPLGAAEEQEQVDLASLDRIRAEGLNPARSQVMAVASWLTDVYGPRLTGTPAIEGAARWTVAQLREWGIEKAELEPWPASPDPEHPSNSFPRGWVNEKFYMSAVGDPAFPIAGTPMAWTPGTNGLERGEAVHIAETTREGMARYEGKLAGKWILAGNVPNVEALWSAPARRYTPEDFERMNAPRPAARGAGRGAPSPPTNFSRIEFFKREGARGVLVTDSRGHGIYTISALSRTSDPSSQLPVIVIPAEAFGRVARVLEKNLPVNLEADIRNTFPERPPMFNVVAELAGTDKAEEVVMIGAHLDAWHASTGATDNAAGSAVVIEAMRILKASGVRLRRTVRAALWTGEEQGLIGSGLYVREHFGGMRNWRGLPPAEPTTAHARFSGYFNLDNGTGAIRGVHLQGNRRATPIFQAWIAALGDLGVTHLRDRSTGGTDHVSFEAAGLPGWQFLQDPIAYDSMTHHTNLDSYERLEAEDMRRNATIVAAFAFSSVRDELMPRP